MQLRLIPIATALLLLSCSEEQHDKPPEEKPPTRGEETSMRVEGKTTAMQSSENIQQLTQSFDMPGHIAPTQRWTQRTNGLCGNKCRNGPRHMYTAAFEDTLLVSWMAVDEADPWKQYGNVATFKVSDTGAFTLLSNVSFKGMCEATYGITTNADGSVIAVLCRGVAGSSYILDGAERLLDTRRAPDCQEDWEGRCYPIGNYSAQDSALYVFEYASGKVSANPDRMVLVNHAVGGWRYGHHELSLNAAENTYFVHLKVTAGPSADNRHEGLTHFALRRGKKFEYVRLTDEWGCGAGHVLANRMAYNRKHDTWSQVCLVDSCPHPNQFANQRCNAVTYYTVPGAIGQADVKYQGEYLLSLDQGANSWTMSGGVSTLLSLGETGFLALVAGTGDVELATKPDAIAVLRIPAAFADLRQTAIDEMVPVFEGGMQTGTQANQRYPWLVLPAAAPDPALGRERRLGMAAMAYFEGRGEDSERLLVGYSPSIAVQGIAAEYIVSELDREGRLRGAPMRLDASGWGEDNLWQTMPSTGCVVFPFAWIGERPGADYPMEREDMVVSDFPSTLHMTSLCPQGLIPPVPSEN